MRTSMKTAEPRRAESFAALATQDPSEVEADFRPASLPTTSRHAPTVRRSIRPLCETTAANFEQLLVR